MAWGDIKSQLNTEIYKGFRIIPNSIYFGGDGAPEKWPIGVTVERVDGSQPQQVCSAKGRFASNETECIRLSLEYGRSVVDGLVSGESTTEL